MLRTFLLFLAFLLVSCGPSGSPPVLSTSNAAYTLKFADFAPNGTVTDNDHATMQRAIRTALNHKLSNGSFPNSMDIIVSSYNIPQETGLPVPFGRKAGSVRLEVFARIENYLAAGRPQPSRTIGIAIPNDKALPVERRIERASEDFANLIYAYLSGNAQAGGRGTSYSSLSDQRSSDSLQ